MSASKRLQKFALRLLLKMQPPKICRLQRTTPEKASEPTSVRHETKGRSVRGEECDVYCAGSRLGVRTRSRRREEPRSARSCDSFSSGLSIPIRLSPWSSRRCFGDGAIRYACRSPSIRFVRPPGSAESGRPTYPQAPTRALGHTFGRGVRFTSARSRAGPANAARALRRVERPVGGLRGRAPAPQGRSTDRCGHHPPPDPVRIRVQPGVRRVVGSSGAVRAQVSTGAGQYRPALVLNGSDRRTADRRRW